MGQPGQPLHRRLYLVPVDPCKERFQFLPIGRRIPGTALLFRLLYQIFVLEERRTPHLLSADVGVQIGPHAGFGRIDLQPAEDGQSFQLPAILLPFLRGSVFVVGNDAAIQSRIADLSNAGGKGILHCLKSCPPVVGIRLGSGQCGDLQQGEVSVVGELLVSIIVIIAFDTAIHDRVGDGLDEVAVVVRASQPLRRQALCGHHDHIGQVPQILLPQFVSLWIR